MRIVLQLACGLLMYGAPLSARGARIRPIATPAPASLVELLQPVHELGVRLVPHGLGVLSAHGGDLGKQIGSLCGFGFRERGLLHGLNLPVLSRIEILEGLRGAVTTARHGHRNEWHWSPKLGAVTTVSNSA